MSDSYPPYRTGTRILSRPASVRAAITSSCMRLFSSIHTALSLRSGTSCAARSTSSVLGGAWLTLMAFSLALRPLNMSKAAREMTASLTLPRRGIGAHLRDCPRPQALLIDAIAEMQHEGCRRGYGFDNRLLAAETAL